LDLESEYEIASVRIFNMEPVALVGAEIRVGNVDSFDGNPACASNLPGDSSVITVTCGATGRYVFVVQPRSDTCLQFSEIEVPIRLGCIACPAGKISADVGASAAAACVDCGPGKYSTAEGSSDASDCVACALTNADSLAGSTDESACFCKPGFYGDGVTSCVACEAGKYFPPTSLTCSGACPCTPSFGLSAGTFSDGPGEYKNDQTCAWTIASVAQVSVWFTSFDTQEGWDFVTIYQCTSADCSTKEQVARLSGSGESADTVFSSATGFLQVQFSSDGSVTGAGFEAAWSVAELKECTACPAGTYADAPAASACTSCPDGSTSPPGSSSASACTLTRRHLAVTTVNEKGVSQGPSIQENKLHVQELARVCEEKCDS